MKCTVSVLLLVAASVTSACERKGGDLSKEEGQPLPIGTRTGGEGPHPDTRSPDTESPERAKNPDPYAASGHGNANRGELPGSDDDGARITTEGAGGNRPRTGAAVR